MDRSLTSIDWSLIQSFLAVADTGSLSRAAEKLGHSQPTLGRHIKSLEQALGLELFHRHARGFALTEIGSEILPVAQHMQQDLARISLLAEAQSGDLTGTVRIACSVFAAHHILPPLVADIRATEPSISLVIQASDESENLLYREADIALRMYRPRQLDLVTRHLTDIPMGIFASHAYIQRRGRPETLHDFLQHDIVGYDQSPLILQGMAAIGVKATAEDFPVRTDNQTAYWELVRAGAGIGFTQTMVGRRDPLVEELALGLEIPPLPLWLTVHEAARKTPRVSRVWDLLIDGLARHINDG